MSQSLSTQYKNGIENKLCIHTLTIVEHLRTPQGVSGKKYQHLITNPQLFQYFPRESRDLFFRGTPAENTLANTVFNNGLNFHEHMIEEPLK